MSLDKNLFTLNVSPRPDDPNIVELIDPLGTIHYRKQRVQGTTYAVDVYDPVAESKLITAAAPNATSKHKTLQLFNPDAVVEFKYTGTISFKWAFKWEDHDFEWRREECYMLRKPDPAVLVAVTKEPAGRLKTTSVQILDYNLNRFDIDDRKGLEIVMLTALLTLHDTNDASHAPRPNENAGTASGSPAALSGLLNLRTRRPSSTDPTQATTRNASESSLPGVSGAVPPPIPPRPPPRTGIERIQELHMLRNLQGEGAANEIEVGEEGAAEDYAEHAFSLLKDEAMLMITISSASPAEVLKVLRVVEETKRLRHKAGMDDEEALFQYVTYGSMGPGRKGPRRINLNDPEPKHKGPASTYAPPSSIMVHLSKFDMPELRPKPEVKDPGPELGWIVDGGANSSTVYTAGKSEDKEKSKSQGKGKEKEKLPSRAEAELQRELEKAQKRADREHKKTEKEHKKKGSPVRPEPNRDTKPSAPNTTYHVPAHQAHPYQPTPTPSQINNPFIYAAPPPQLPRPSSQYGVPPPAAPFPPLGWAGYPAPPPAPQSTNPFHWRR